MKSHCGLADKCHYQILYCPDSDISYFIYCMCQCLICGCCWWNYCGVCCGGIHEAFCVCSYWLCKPEDLRLIDPECCHVCACDGWGYNCLWYGIICCAPKAVMEWSGLRTAGKTASDLNKHTVIINNTSPIYMPQQQEMVYPGPNYSPYGGPPQNFNVNVGVGGGYQGSPPPYQMNAKINF